MRKFLALAAALFCAVASAATTTPIQLLSPAGSTSGQAIVSNGPSSAPTWQAVPLTGVTGVLPIANGGTNASTAATALSNLGGAALTGAAFTGNVSVTRSSGDAILSVSRPAGSFGFLTFQTAGVARWNLQIDSDAESGSNAGSSLSLWALTDAGSAAGRAFSVPRATQVVAFDKRPTFAGNTPWDSGNLNFASPPAIGGTTPAAGAFTTLSSTGAFTPSQTAGIVGTTTNNNANAGSVGEYNTNTTTGTSLTSGVSANATSVTLTAGDYDVWGVVVFLPAGSTTVAGINAAINTVSATFPASLTQRTSLNATLTTGAGQALTAPVTRISIASTTTVYLVALAAFGTSTMTCDGRIEWRRVR